MFDLVAKRFIAAFYPDCQVSNTTVLAEVSDEMNRLQKGGNAVIFRATGRQVLVPGWREVFAVPTKDKTTTEDDAESEGKGEGEETQASMLPDFQAYEMGHHVPQLVEKQTTPPKPYTEATLLRAMETAGKTVDDDELRDALKENGIGRPSTRAAIIEKLFQRKYIVRKGKSIAPTPLGIELIGIIHTPLLKSASLTGLWEKKLRQIERGELSSQDFLSELKQMTSEVVLEVKSSPVGMLCPQCHRGIIIRGRSAYGCSCWREGCTYRAPFV